MKLPYPCPDCGKPIMNYSGKCAACGRGMRAQAPLIEPDMSTPTYIQQILAKLGVIEQRLEQIERQLRETQGA